MHIESIQITGEMGEFRVIRMNDESVGVTRILTGDFFSTNMVNDLAVAIDGVNHMDYNKAMEIFMVLGISLEDK